MSRRSFFRQLGGFGVATVAAPNEWALLRAGPRRRRRPLGLHPFIEAHPEAVFIRRTKVAAKTDAEAIRREALALAREVFTVRQGPRRPCHPDRRDQAEPDLHEEDGADPRHRDRPVRRRGPRGRPRGARHRPRVRSSCARA